MNYWHIQLHPGEFDDWTLDDIMQIVDKGLIGCSGDPVSDFNKIRVGDIVLVRHGGAILALVQVKKPPRDILASEKSHSVWFDRGAEVEVLKRFSDKRVSGEGWYLAKTLMPISPDNKIAFPFIRNLYVEVKDEREMNTVVNILKYKKQIILQGPPGTGKTRLAKEIAESLIGVTKIEKKKEINDNDIVSALKDVDKLSTVAGNVVYEIIKVDNSKKEVTLKRSTGSDDTTSFFKIKEFYKGKLWKSEFQDNDDRRAAAIAKYIFDSQNSEASLADAAQSKLIQFHPSYSYEDFVRGIVTESKGERVEFKNVNKILGKFAAEAKSNWDDVHKDVSHVSKEKRVREYFDEFVDELTEQVTAGKSVPLTPSVNLIDVEEDAFRYKGADGWSTLGNRMPFKDIIQAFLDGNQVRQDIKKNVNLSGLAIQHASYFIRVLNMFQDFLRQRAYTFDNLSAEKPILKNYVLIIDEINRANLSSVLGELIYALEYRGENVESMYEVDGSNKLVLPPNLYIIGTMNTADRSVGHIDYAIRRRFAFVDVLPQVLNNDFETELFKRVSALFVKDINAQELEPSIHLSSEFKPKDVWLGHSYFIKKEDVDSSVRLQFEIIPILEEYIKDGVLIESTELRTIIRNLENSFSAS